MSELLARDTVWRRLIDKFTVSPTPHSHNDVLRSRSELSTARKKDGECGSQIVVLRKVSAPFSPPTHYVMRIKRAPELNATCVASSVVISWTFPTGHRLVYTFALKAICTILLRDTSRYRIGGR